MGRNIGEQFLFSKDHGFISREDGESYIYSDGSGYYHGNDGSDGYIYSDGSGYYHGSDGSDGYIYSDGSGYYHGSDGSNGYIYSDGSGYYHGNDGSDGYKYSDGSGYFNYSNGDSTSYYQDDDYEDEDKDEDEYDEENNDPIAVSLVKLIFSIGLIKFTDAMENMREEERQKEKEQLEAERIRIEKQAIRKKAQKIRNKRLKAFLFNKKKIKLDNSVNDLVGNKIENVVEILKETGFNNYKTVPIKDIYIDNNFFVGEVQEVIINGQSYFKENDMIPYDAEIIITYHLKKEIVIPYSSHQVIKKNYNDVIQDLYSLGFTEVSADKICDLITGWIVKDGSVQQISINEKTSFKKDSIFDYDAKIVVKYHTFKE